MSVKNPVFISAALALVAVNAMAAAEITSNADPVKETASVVDPELAAAIDQILNRQSVVLATQDAFAVMAKAFEIEPGQTLNSKYQHYFNMTAANPGNQLDSTNASTGGAFSCYANCHSACHGSRGWR